MKSILPLTLLCLSLIGSYGFISSPVDAHEDDIQKPVEVTHKQRYAATAMPDRILLSWQDDPATSFSVTWRTDTTIDIGLGEIAIATDGPKFTSKKKVTSISVQGCEPVRSIYLLVGQSPPSE